MRDARKLFRLLKSFNEIAKLLDLFELDNTTTNVTTNHTRVPLRSASWNPEEFSHDKLARRLFITSKCGYAIYWMFDNASIFASFFSHTPDLERMCLKLASCGWLAGIIPQMITDLLDLRQLLTSENRTPWFRRIKEKSRVPFTLDEEKLNLCMSLITCTGNVISALHTLELVPWIPESIVGGAGLLSALLRVYHLWDVHWRKSKDVDKLLLE